MQIHSQCRSNNSSKRSNCYGPRVFGGSRSSAINLIYYIVYKTFFNLRSQYCAKLAVSSKLRFSIEGCLCPEILVRLFL